MSYTKDKKENKAILKAVAAVYGVKIQLNSYQAAVRSFFQAYPSAFGCYISDKRLPTHIQFALQIDNRTKEVSVVTCDYILAYGMNHRTFLPLINS